ncbi:hypothetical protein ERJ75_000227600 [Trypanosoma vivax]|nr:hypothetical protein ERJ75_000227600 [Trypanosoma vivax]
MNSTSQKAEELHATAGGVSLEGGFARPSCRVGLTRGPGAREPGAGSRPRAPAEEGRTETQCRNRSQWELSAEAGTRGELGREMTRSSGVGLESVEPPAEDAKMKEAARFWGGNAVECSG